MQTLEQLHNGELKGIVSLRISEGLKDFPREIFELADTLECLDLSGNQLSALPHDFGRLTKLKILFCSDNLFTVLPEVLADIAGLDIVGFKSNRIEFVPPKALNPHIRWLILTNNKLQMLPPAIGNCLRLQKLMLAGNNIIYLPQELQLCRNLALIRVAANELPFLPKWLYSMPSLAWIAFSGNKISKGGVGLLVPQIDLEELEFKDQLGAGASGTIYKAFNKVTNTDVAVKIFKGTVTSDGFPEDEMNAYIEAGSHPGLVRLLGKVDARVENVKGLVMELIQSSFHNLGDPPSFESCTRDVFAAELELSDVQVLKVASTIASLCEHLHERGIIHGDLYAHNILMDADANVLFGDFGAASFYDTKNIEQAFYLQRIEVRAFGYLIDDLLLRCGHNSMQEMKNLRDSCLSQEINLRPSFKEITARLQSLKSTSF
ncbi:protein kinase [Pedobacter endophyticus]|uniref:Protein kinase n=1 Tax=Pedobacter endophyticus TaxID=2789740 RepID=A0A7U3Q4L6_9SPHI|nr:protein kinase [Pedobacter endophyticus]QPH38372.1 protein kinase [Pedobacter endophyticus]